VAVPYGPYTILYYFIFPYKMSTRRKFESGALKRKAAKHKRRKYQQKY
jgi:hypothetical protein